MERSARPGAAAIQRLSVASQPGPSAAAAKLQSLGGERPVIARIAGDQTLPQLAIEPTGVGGGLLVWEDNSITRLGLRIRAQRLSDGLMPIGQPFPVSSAWNSKTGGEQGEPAIAMRPDGSALIVWQTALLGKKGTAYQIYARSISASGTPLGKDIKVSAERVRNLTSPAVAALADGGYIVVWSNHGGDGSLQAIFAQRFSGDGKKVGKEFRVNEWTANNQRSPAVAALADGGFLVGWVSELQRGLTSVDVFARRYTSAGVAVASEFAVNVTTSNACANPVIVGTPEGGFAVAWSQKDDSLLSASVARDVRAVLSQNSWDVFCRIFDSAGTAVTAPFRVNSRAYGDQFAPRIAVLNGNFVTTWTSLGQDGSREGIYGQAFAPNGDFQGAEFQINDTTISRQIHPAIAAAGNQFVVTWTSIAAGTGFDLMVRSYLQTFE
jgi:hypothetical protein